MTELTKLSYMGRDVETMPREELINVIRDLCAWQQTLLQVGKQEREMFGNIVKSLRPR
jgi:hypothetical protein